MSGPFQIRSHSLGGTMKTGISLYRFVLAGAIAAIVACDVVTAPPTEEPVEIAAPPVERPPACPGYAIPDRCPPFPTGGSNVIVGNVVERTSEGTRAASGVMIWHWVQQARSGYAGGRVISDAKGNFEITTLPNAQIVIQAWGSFDHPCANVVDLNQPSVEVGVEVVSPSAPIFDPDPPLPAVTGVVYENVGGVRVPMAGVRVFLETASEIIAATTTTDEQGRYSLCRLPSIPLYVVPFKDGYELKYHPVQVGGLVKLDLEMTRK